MRPRTAIGVGLLLAAALAGGILATGGFRRDRVTVVRIPEGGRMPRAVGDGAGVIHLMYFDGVMSGGDILYAHRTPRASGWSEPHPVNSVPRSAVGVGPIDGGQLALGHDGRLHVVWFQTNPVRLFYTRSTVDRTRFESQRVLAEFASELFEATPTVTADSENRIFVLWHGATIRDADDVRRAVYMMRSTGGGVVFDEPIAISPLAEGACGCCGIQALAHTDGTLAVSYRGARDNIRRGQRLLTSHDAGRTWTDTLLEPWEIAACPVTTTSIAAGPNALWVAWETLGQVKFASHRAPERTLPPSGSSRHRRKNPVIAVSASGETLVAWGDGPGFRARGTYVALGIIRCRRSSNPARRSHYRLYSERQHACGDGPA